MEENERIFLIELSKYCPENVGHLSKIQIGLVLFLDVKKLDSDLHL